MHDDKLEYTLTATPHNTEIKDINTAVTAARPYTGPKTAGFTLAIRSMIMEPNQTVNSPGASAGRQNHEVWSHNS